MMRRPYDPDDPDHWTNPQDDPGDFPDIRVLGGNHPDLALDTYSTRCAGSDCLVRPAAHHVVRRERRGGVMRIVNAEHLKVGDEIKIQTTLRARVVDVAKPIDSESRDVIYEVILDGLPLRGQMSYGRFSQVEVA